MKQIVAINTGSSSLKAALYSADQGKLILRGQLRIPAIGDLRGSLDPFFKEYSISAPHIFSHRLVHGGVTFTDPIVVDTNVRSKLDGLIALDPLHLPPALAIMDLAKDMFPRAVHVACFDTAFHRGHPWVADTYGIPRTFYDEGIRRYGFHGLSYEWVARQLANLLEVPDRKRTIVAHLGSGASMCALLEGKSIASTMGFSPLEGLLMGTRPGQLDPGVVLYLLKEKKMSVDTLSDLLNHQSGLLGLSGISADMQELLLSSDSHAHQAIEYFIHRIVCAAGEMIAVMGGIDSFVFTGGIGEHVHAIRDEVVKRFSWLGWKIDPASNQANAQCISMADSMVKIMVIPTNEEWILAHHAAALAV